MRAHSAKLYRQEADKGDAFAQNVLGRRYEVGDGVPQDDVQADMWYTLAIAGGEQGAEGIRDILEKKMTSAQITEARKLASAWKPVGAGTASPPAASTTPATRVSQPVAPASAGPASPHPRIGPV